MKALHRSVIFAALSVLVWSSCKVEKTKIVTESTKDISGSWKIVKVTRNGTDITAANGLDFSQFRVNFLSNKTYTLTNALPFIVQANGTYSLNDPQVPTEITFTQNGSPAITTDFVYPIVGGVRQISLQFSANPGCNNNSYVYTLQKAN